MDQVLTPINQRGTTSMSNDFILVKNKLISPPILHTPY